MAGIIGFPVLITLSSIPFLLLAGRPSLPPELPRGEKMAHILRCEDTRSVGAGELDRYLHDADRSVRRRAALAAGRIGDQSLTPSLIALMNDSETEVRQMAAFALGLLADARAVDRLLPALADTQPVVRGRAAEALGRIGDLRAAPEVAQQVLRALPEGAPQLTIRGDDPSSLADSWLEVRLGLFALARLKDAKAAETVLLNAGKPRFDWWAATWTAMRLESPTLRPLLLAAVTSNDPLSRAFAARGLGALKDPTAFDALSALARDADESVVVNAIRALALIGDPRATGVVSGLLRPQNSTLLTEALRALATLPPDRTLRNRIVPLIGHEDPSVRGAALQVLARIDREDFALILSGLDADPVWSVRAALATGLGAAGDEVSLNVLFGMLKDEDPRVLPAVLEALRKVRGADAADTLRRHLQHPDLAVRVAAVEGLVALKTPGLSGTLATAYRAALADPDSDVRAALVDALAAQKDEGARALLAEAAAKDPARVVRQRAGGALQAQGVQAPPLGPEPIERAAVDYREAIAPYVPFPDTPVYTPRAFIHTKYGRIEIHLNVVEAPLTVAAFVDLARRGFYDGLTFHRVVPGFVVQGGDPRGDGNGGPGYTLRCEIGQRPYGRGAVGMALSGKDTGGSQFFITHTPTPHLDGGYTLFGWVVSGIEVVDKIRQGDTIERVEVWTGR